MSVLVYYFLMFDLLEGGEILVQPGLHQAFVPPMQGRALGYDLELLIIEKFLQRLKVL